MNYQQGRTAVLTGNPYLTGNFAPVQIETTALNLRVDGIIPAELDGRLLRIGPNPVEPPDSGTYHWFVGNGMVHGLRLRDGAAEWYRNRYVVDSHVAHVLEKNEIPGPGMNNQFSVNTNVVGVNGKTYAIVEAGGLPIEVDFELESISRTDFDSSLEAGFSAHPRLDPETGDMHVIAYQPGNPFLQYVVLNKFGRANTVAKVLAPHCPMIHDTAITATHVVILDLPVTFQPGVASPGSFPFLWDPSLQPRVGLLPRNGDVANLQWFAAPSSFVFHILNAYDDGECVIVDVVRHPRMFDQERRGPWEGDSVLVRWTLNARTGKLSESVLDDHAVEFPRLNDAFTGRDYRFGYTAEFSDGLRFGSLYKHDLKSQATIEHDFGPGKAAAEPVFIARENAKSEDDGWILSYVFDENQNTSEVVILDAQDFQSKPLASIKLPVRVPFGFHGNWIPAVC